MIFIYNQALLLQGEAVGIAALILVMLMAIVCLSAALTGYFFRMLNPVFRLVMAAGAIGGFVLCAHPDVMENPAVLVAAIGGWAGFFLWIFFFRQNRERVV